MKDGNKSNEINLFLIYELRVECWVKFYLFAFYLFTTNPPPDRYKGFVQQPFESGN